MKKKLSKKHHYLPRHYLKGFTNSENSFLFMINRRKESLTDKGIKIVEYFNVKDE